ncbi:hypothetical protein M1N56_06070 [Dehalococcoidia bacterium]|nr:hypothetical protein [Dehalococcoidia bacterium]
MKACSVKTNIVFSSILLVLVLFAVGCGGVDIAEVIDSAEENLQAAENKHMGSKLVFTGYAWHSNRGIVWVIPEKSYSGGPAVRCSMSYEDFGRPHNGTTEFSGIISAIKSAPVSNGDEGIMIHIEDCRPNRKSKDRPSDWNDGKRTFRE